MLVCIHSTTLGPAMGGTRLKSYPSPADALEDGLRLAEGMTRKLAVVGLPCGGGKAVIAIPEIPTGDDRRRLFERYADLIDALGGTYVTGPDVNTGEADMDVIGARTPHVFCRSTGKRRLRRPEHPHRARRLPRDSLLARPCPRLRRARRPDGARPGNGLGRREARAAAPRRGRGRARQRRRRGSRAGDRGRARFPPTERSSSSATSTRRARSERR